MSLSLPLPTSLGLGGTGIQPLIQQFDSEVRVTDLGPSSRITASLNGDEVFRINYDKRFGIGTTAPEDKRLVINDPSGNVLRLVYNDSDGSPANYADFNIDNTGQMTLFSTGDNIFIDNQTSFDVSSHDGFSQGLKLNGILLTATADEFNYLDLPSGPGIATPLKALVTDANNNITGLDTLSLEHLIADTISVTNFSVSGLISNFAIGGLKVNSFSETNMQGKMIHQAVEDDMDFVDYDPVNQYDGFSMEIIGYIRTGDSNNYTFYVTTNFGCRIWVDNQLIFNKWTQSSTDLASDFVYLQANRWYPIRIHTYHVSGTHRFLLEWESIAQTKEKIPSARMAWDNIENNVNIHPITSPEFVQIYDLDSNNKNIGIISLNNAGVMELSSTSKDVNIVVHDGINGLHLNGVLLTTSANELNILDGATLNTAELNILDGATLNTAELNTLDGITATTAELNLMDGVTANTTEINYIDTTPGTAEPTKALVVDGSRDISNINTLTATNLITTNFTMTGLINNFATGALAVNSFSGDNMDGRLIKQLIETDIDFTDYDPSGQTDNFSIEVVGYINPVYSETYTFYLTANEGARLWVDEELIFNNWTGNCTDEASTAIALTTGKWHTIRIHCHDITGTHRLLIEWESASQIKSKIPAINMAWDNTQMPPSIRKANIADSIVIYNSNTDTKFISSLETDATGQLNIDSTTSEVNIVNHNETTTGLKLNNVLITSSATEINLLDGVTATTTELNYVDTTPGIAQPTKALITDASKNIAEINNFHMSGPDMLMGDNTGANNGILRITKDSGKIYAQPGLNNTTGSATDLFIVDYNESETVSDRIFGIKADGKVGIQTHAPDKQLEVNSITGDCMRLTYNDKDGSAVNYTDFIITSAGQLNIDSSSDNVNIVGHDGATKGLHLDGILITATAAELNIMDGVTATTIEINLLDGVTATTTELNYVDTTPGIAQPTKALVVDASKNIAEINDIHMSGPNMLMGDNTGANNGILRITRQGGKIYAQPGLNNTTGSATDLFIVDYNEIETVSDRIFGIKADGKVGIQTYAPDKQLEINSATGDCLRLTHNDIDGSATNYVDITVSSAGYLSLSPSGNTTFNEGQMIIDHTGTEALLVRKDGDAGDILVVDTTNGRVGINVKPTQPLTLLTPDVHMVKMTSTFVGGGAYMEINNNSGTRALFGCDGINFNGGADTDVIVANWSNGALKTYTNATFRTILTATGLMGINTTAPDKQLEINSATGDCLRLTYNDNNGSAVNYVDLTVSSGGNLNIIPSSGTTGHEGQFIVDYTSPEALLVRKDADGGDIFIVDTNADAIYSNAVQIIDHNSTLAFLVRKDGDVGDVFRVNTVDSRVGINTSAPDKELEVNGCIRITNNDSDGSAVNYTDLCVSATGQLDIDSSSDNVNIVGHDGGTKGLRLNNVLITATAAELNTMDGITATTVELNLMDGVTATTTEINYIDTTPGTAEPTKALVVDANRDISNINTLTTTNLITTNFTMEGIINNFAEGGLVVNSFTNTNMDGRLFKQLVETDIDFTDYNPTGQADNFSLEVVGYIKPLYTETYTFYLTTDDGVRLWVNDVLLYQNWGAVLITDQATTTISLTAGRWYPIRIHQQEVAGGHRLLLNWESASQTKGKIPAANMAWDNTQMPPSFRNVHISDSLKVYDSESTGIQYYWIVDKNQNNAELFRDLLIEGTTGFDSATETATLYLGDTNTFTQSIHSTGITNQTNYSNIKFNTSGANTRLTISDTVSTFDSRIFIDYTSPEALLVRKDGDSGDVFIVDTSNSRIGINIIPTESLSLSATDAKLAKFSRTTIGGGAYIEISNQTGTRALFGPDGSGFSGGADTDVIAANWTNGAFKTYTNALERTVITSTGLMGINTTAPDKQLEINSITGDCLRLTYNDNNGSAVNYCDLTVSSGGNLNIIPSSGTTGHEGQFIVDYTSPEALLVRKDADGGDVFVVDTTNQVVRQEADVAATNTVDNHFILRRTTTGTAAAGFGTGLKYELENASATIVESSSIQSIFTDATDSIEDVTLQFNVMSNGTVTQRADLDHLGTFTVTNLVETSDMRVKENIIPSDLYDGFTKIKNIKLHDFNLKEDPKKITKRGVIAQELKEIIPAAVEISKKNGIDDFHSINTKELLGHLIASVQYIIKKLDIE